MKPREIRFRAWDEKNKQMVEADLDYFTDASRHCPFRSCVQQALIDRREPKVMQFTGLHDKKGKEIFEGDIVQNDNGNRFVITWWPEQCGFVQLKWGTFFHEPTTMPMAMNNKEVLGNIYENPEILESK